MDLRPSGVALFCPGSKNSITVTCELNWTSTNTMRWDVNANGLTPQMLFIGRSITDTQNINNIGKIISTLNNGSDIVARLEVPDSSGLIPTTVECGDGGTVVQQQLVIQYKGRDNLSFSLVL